MSRREQLHKVLAANPAVRPGDMRSNNVAFTEFCTLSKGLRGHDQSRGEHHRGCDEQHMAGVERTHEHVEKHRDCEAAMSAITRLNANSVVESASHRTFSSEA